MKKIIQSLAFISLVTSISTYATVYFALTNKSPQPIWICGYADEDVFTGGTAYDCEKKILPGESFSANISNGAMEITISLIEPGRRSGQDKYRRYMTTTSANNKNKILIWNHTGNPKAPLHPAPDKRVLGLVKTQKQNNINANELKLTGYNNL